jgi:hypothetical protein
MSVQPRHVAPSYFLSPPPAPLEYVMVRANSRNQFQFTGDSLTVRIVKQLNHAPLETPSQILNRYQ